MSLKRQIWIHLRIKNEMSKAEAPFESNSDIQLEIRLLHQFKQIILYGPPGTGKTYRAKTEILPQLLGIDKDAVDKEQGKRWNIVQFHPSYNYEDFVRGVRVETVGDNVVYNVVDQVFGGICKRAEGDANNDYALIIDEINRANVSAVLGELIYALEYRGEKIKTPYAIGKDFTLLIPKNLYIIGTMNTADRTIGQIDYAVRRRFAFVHCPPDGSIIKGIAFDAFSDVQSIFKKYISPDYDAEDVRIGHSYFLPKDSVKGFAAGELARKIKYQVVPILWEYVKDGVLLKDAEKEIAKIKDNFLGYDLEESDDESIDDEFSNDADKKNVYYWENDGRFSINNIRRTVFSIVQDYVNQNPEITLEELQEWFPDRHKETQYRGIKFELNEGNRSRFFALSVGDQTAYVTNQWGIMSETFKHGNFREFISDVHAKSGYKIRHCYGVNIGEREGKRSWDACVEFGFVAASGKSVKGIEHKMFKQIEKGAIIFACLLQDSDGNKGFVGMGEVMESAVPISQFEVGGVSILKSKCKDGQNYSDKYPIAAEHADENDPRCEWLIRVKWKKLFLREEAKGITGRNVTYSWFSSEILNSVKQEFEEGEQ